jgi:hypothetical protein
MRLPRGHRDRLRRRRLRQAVVNDYGPIKPSRIVDLYRADFFDICGCAWWSGTTTVTVSVY